MENPVRWDPSELFDSFTISGLGSLRGVHEGLGCLYFYMDDNKPELHSEFVPILSTPADYSTLESQAVTARLDASVRVPCSGIITPDRDGAFIIAPVLYLDEPGGRDIVLMLVSPPTTIRELSIDKTAIEIPTDEATVTLFTGNGELRCLGKISGQGVKAARLVLNRNPGLPVYPAGFNEILCEVDGHGEMFTVWKPVARSFEKCLIVFHPSQVDSSSFEDVAEYLGAPEDDFTGTMKSNVVGDGVGVNYTVSLVLDRGLGRHSSDQVRLTVT